MKFLMRISINALVNNFVKKECYYYYKEFGIDICFWQLLKKKFV